MWGKFAYMGNLHDLHMSGCGFDLPKFDLTISDISKSISQPVNHLSRTINTSEQSKTVENLARGLQAFISDPLPVDTRKTTISQVN